MQNIAKWSNILSNWNYKKRRESKWGRTHYSIVIEEIMAQSYPKWMEKKCTDIHKAL